MVACGGLKFVKFVRDNTFEIRPIISDDGSNQKIKTSRLLLYLGKERGSTEIHKDQTCNFGRKIDVYDRMRNLTIEALHAFKKGDLDLMREAMNRNWNFKKSLSTEMSDGRTDNLYSKAIELGAKGGNVVGAGGG